VRLWSATTPGATQYINRVSSTYYKFYQPIGGGRYWRQDFKTIASLPGGKTPIPLQMNYQYGEIPYTTKAFSDAQFAYTGAGWASSALSGTYNGSYTRTTTSGDYVVWTTSAASIIFIRYAALSNVGLALVTLDGSRTAATGCSTAQDLVTAGTFPNTILVANGGTLNPTDRVINQYAASGSSDTFQLIADGLTEAAHTVRLTCTGYKQAASSDIRLNVTAGSIAASTIVPTTSGVAFYLEKRILDQQDSAFEWAFNVYASAASSATSTWVGNVHGYEDMTALTLTIDGSGTTMTDGQYLSGASIVFVRTSRLYHPSIGAGATVIGDAVTTYTLNNTGLVVSYSLTWNVALKMMIGYHAMYPTNEDVGGPTKGATSGSGATSYTLTAQDGSRKSQTLADTVWLWCPAAGGVAGHYGATMRCAQAGIGFGGNASPDFTFIEDRIISAGRLVNKTYFTRQSDTAAVENIAATTNWTNTTTYRVSWVPDADATFG
jgi:hypothetical protein